MGLTFFSAIIYKKVLTPYIKGNSVDLTARHPAEIRRKE